MSRGHPAHQNQPLLISAYVIMRAIAARCPALGSVCRGDMVFTPLVPAVSSAHSQALQTWRTRSDPCRPPTQIPAMQGQDGGISAAVLEDTEEDKNFRMLPMELSSTRTLASSWMLKFALCLPFLPFWLLAAVLLHAEVWWGAERDGSRRGRGRCRSDVLAGGPPRLRCCLPALGLDCG